MTYQTDVLKSVSDGFLDHAKFYFNTYAKASEKDKSDFRSHVIEHESRWSERNISDSAKLLLAEHFDSHPGDRQAAQQYLETLQHDDHTLVTNSEGQQGHRGAFREEHVAHVQGEQLKILTGAFIPAVIQGVANLIWSNPEDALHYAAPFVTLGEALSAHGEARLAGHENAHRVEESLSGHNTSKLAHEIGKEQILESLGETQANNGHWSHTSAELGNGALSDLQDKHGREAVQGLADTYHASDPQPGFTGYRGPTEVSPESSETTHHSENTATSQIRQQHPEPGLSQGRDTASPWHDTGMNVSGEGTGSVPGHGHHHSGTGHPHGHDSGMSVADDATGPASGHGHHHSGIAHSHGHDVGMSISDDGTGPASGHGHQHSGTGHFHNVGMSVSDDGTGQSSGHGHHHSGAGHAHGHDVGMSISDEGTGPASGHGHQHSGTGHSHDVGMKVSDDGTGQSSGHGHHYSGTGHSHGYDVGMSISDDGTGPASGHGHQHSGTGHSHDVGMHVSDDGTGQSSGHGHHYSGTGHSHGHDVGISVSSDGTGSASDKAHHAEQAGTNSGAVQGPEHQAGAVTHDINITNIPTPHVDANPHDNGNMSHHP